jgi:hypothetical protein
VKKVASPTMKPPHFSPCAPSPTGEVGFLTRKQLAQRWACSVATIKRIEKRKALSGVRIGLRIIRYRVADILHVEGTNTVK